MSVCPCVQIVTVLKLKITITKCYKTYYHKSQIQFEFLWCHFYRSRVMPLVRTFLLRSTLLHPNKFTKKSIQFLIEYFCSIDMGCFWQYHAHTSGNHIIILQWFLSKMDVVTLLFSLNISIYMLYLMIIHNIYKGSDWRRMWPLPF